MPRQSQTRKWQHPGGKLRELGAASLDDSEMQYYAKEILAI